MTKPRIRQDGAPALVKTSIRRCRHYSAGNDGQKFQSAEERLQCEVAEANRILLTVVEGVAQDTAEPFYEGLEKRRNALMSRFYNAVAHDFASGTLESLSVEAAKTLAFINTTVGSGDVPRRALTGITQPLQNILVLLTSLSLTEDDFTLLRQTQGLTQALNRQLSNVLHAAFPVSTEKEFEILLIRFGVAKYHLYTDGVKFSRRRGRVKTSTSAPVMDANFLVPDRASDAPSRGYLDAEDLSTGCAR